MYAQHELGRGLSKRFMAPLRCTPSLRYDPLWLLNFYIVGEEKAGNTDECGEPRTRIPGKMDYVDVQ